MIKGPLSIRNILLLTIGALSFLVAIFTLQQVYLEFRRMENFHVLKKAIHTGDRLFEAAEKLSVEKDAAYLVLSTADADLSASLAQRLKDNRAETDAALRESLDELAKYNIKDFTAKTGESLDRLDSIQGLRKRVDAAVGNPGGQADLQLAAEWLGETTRLVHLLRGLWAEFMSKFNTIDPRVTLQNQIKFFLGSITEEAGAERALIGRFLVENSVPTPEEQARLIRGQGKLELDWQIISSLAGQSGQQATIGPFLTDAHSQYLNLYDMIRVLFYVPGEKMTPPYPISPDLWLELATQATDSLYALNDAALKASRALINGQEREVWNSILLRICVLAVSLALCLASFRVVTKRVLQPIQEIIEALLRTSRGEEAQTNLVVLERQDEIGKLARVLRSFQQTMEDMKRYTLDLERSNKELDDFAYIASHDLKEPLRGISNHARFLLDDNEGKLDKDSVSRISRLIFLSQRIEKLINDLLYFSRLGRQEFAIKKTDLGGMVRDVENTLAEFLKTNNAVISVPRPLPSMTCDEVRVMEVFRNLVVNGVKYNDSPKKVIEIGFLDSHRDAKGVERKNVIYVKDNGHGIRPEFHEEIFRIFRRIEKPHQKPDDGNGVGLTFVKKIVEKHGGNIWLESEFGKGTTFYFTLNEGELKHARRAAA